MLYRIRFIILLLALLPLAGCSAADSLGLKIDLSQLNWQTGALIALAYFANSKGHFATIAQAALKILRGTRLLPQPEDSKSLQADQIAKILADLFTQLQGHPELQAQVLSMMSVSSGAAIDKTYVSDKGQAPSLKDLPVACAAGGGIHFGVFWGVKITTKKVGDRTFKVWSSTPGNGGGHALEIVSCLSIDGAWWPLVWNSHGDGPILMPPEKYEYYQSRQFRPFGGYLLLPDRAKQRFEDRRLSGGGYWFAGNVV